MNERIDTEDKKQIGDRIRGKIKILLVYQQKCMKTNNREIDILQKRMN